MRWLAVVGIALLAACSGSKATGPAWPAPSTTADDGGESIEPRTTTAAASLEKSADAVVAEDKDKPADDAKPAAAAAEDKPAAGAQPSMPVIEDVIITDEIIIEIDD